VESGSREENALKQLARILIAKPVFTFAEYALAAEN
jgi:hypothetical protein